MSLRYSVAVAPLDGAALIKQFAHARIESDDVWNLIDMTDVHKVAEYRQAQDALAKSGSLTPTVSSLM